MSRVVALQHKEGVRLDAARLVGLVTDLGAGPAEAAIARAMEDMALCLAQMERHYQDGNTRAVCHDAHTLAWRAAEVGMTSLSRVATDVHDCAARGDMVAFAATWARLDRIAERSLSAVWDLEGTASEP